MSNKLTIRIIKIFITLFLIGVSVYIVLALFVAYFVPSQSLQKADMALILGAKSYKDSSFNPCLVSRVKTGEALFKNHQVKILLMSGGDDTEDERNEAVTMQEIAIKDGLPASKILLETKSTSTFENIKNSQIVMSKNKLKTAILVTEPFHIARARLIARSLGMNATYQGADTSPCWTRWKYLSRYFLKEPLAIVGYVFMGKIKISAFFN